ncbi:hypothetical protein [Allobranchiibius sp. GilTou38]|uniref:hypothetical protein n=1 Tax=Allobranchiibius sp. GilTou38 TaxID=2815210 RepID=UPI001AA1A8F5|nr:hypothetical protein [Allobranchiibius sp. GilTou38]MBO1767208.1 hypothetical protein [Allobranchiibius sp. GilTou38]
MTRVMELWPQISREMEELLRADGHTALADQVTTLEFAQMCGCGDSFCDTFFTVPRPDGAWQPQRWTIDLEPSWAGYLLIHVQQTSPERIIEVEVLYRDGLS